MATLQFGFAQHQDDVRLRALMRDNVMAGPVAVTFRREPSYFLATAVQGAAGQIIKAVDVQTQAWACVGGRFTVPAYVNGQRIHMGYLADLRLEAAYRKGYVLRRAFDFLRQCHQHDPLPLYTTMILQGNTPALRTLAANRAGMPRYVAQGFVHTPLLLLAGRKNNITLAGVHVAVGRDEDAAAVFAFLNREHKRRQFAPHYDVADLGTPRLLGLSMADFMVAWQDGQVVGAMAGWDQSLCRQIHVHSYHGHWRWLKPVYHVLSQVAGLPKLPKPGGMLHHGYVALWAVAQDNKDVFRVLLRALYCARYGKGWHYMVCAMHECDPLLPLLREYRHIDAGGHLFTVHLDESTGITPDHRVPYIEAAAL